MPGATDHISELLGTQGQPEIDDQGQDDGLDSGLEADGGQEPPDPAVQQEPTAEEPPSGRKPRKNVPLTALQEERAKRQELQDQYTQERERNDRAEQRLQQMMQLIQQQQQPQQPQPQEAPVPSFVDDPEGHVNALRQQIEQLQNHLQGNYQQQQQQQQALQQGQQLATMAAKAEEEFKAVTPDYLQATEFFLKRKQAEYSAFGLDPVTLNAQVQRDYQTLAVAAMQMGKNPAKVLYDMAKAMGYGTPAAGATGGQRQAPAARPVAPTSLSDIGGAPRAPDEEGELTADALADMTDAEFDKFWNKMARQSRVSPKF